MRALTDTSPAELRKRAAYALVGIGILFVVLEYGLRPAFDWCYQQRLLLLAQYVTAHGQPNEQHPAIAKYFDIPLEGQPLIYRTVATNSITGRNKAIKVRERLTGQIDLLFSDVHADQSGFFYHANVYGALLKACFLETQPQDVPDAEKRFAAEVQFWQDWLQAQQEAATP